MNAAETKERPRTGPGGPSLGRSTSDAEGDPRLTPLWQKQLPLLLMVAVALIVGLAASGIPALREILTPVFWEHPFYLNPFITFTLMIYVGLGLVMVTGTGDQGWPWYLLLIGIWVFMIAFEYSIVQWFAIQGGLLLGGSHINPILFTAAAVAVGAAVLLHMNQLNRRLQSGLTQRGVDPEELHDVESHAGQQARVIVAQLVALIFAATLILWVADLIVGSTGLGLNVLGILAGLMVMSVLLAYSYAVLKKGPIVAQQQAGAHPGPGPDPAYEGGAYTTGHMPRSRPTGSGAQEPSRMQNGPDTDTDTDDEQAGGTTWIRRD